MGKKYIIDSTVGIGAPKVAPPKFPFWMLGLLAIPLLLIKDKNKKAG